MGVCLQGAVIVLSCLIFSAYMGSGSPAAPSGSAVSMVWTYVTEIIFNMLVLVGLVKSSDRIVREMMGLRGMRASLAQLDRAFGSDPEGRWFESSRAHQKTCCDTMS